MSTEFQFTPTGQRICTRSSGGAMPNGDSIIIFTFDNLSQLADVLSILRMVPDALFVDGDNGVGTISCKQMLNLLEVGVQGSTKTCRVIFNFRGNDDGPWGRI